jgi:hypothetical protein
LCGCAALAERLRCLLAAVWRACGGCDVQLTIGQGPKHIGAAGTELRDPAGQ